MAIKSMWSGQLTIAGTYNVPVAVCKAVESGYSKGGLKRLSECHEVPFNRPSDVCSHKGCKNQPESDAAIGRGEKHLTPAVYGVEVADGYKVVDSDEIERISEATELVDLEVDRAVPLDDLPWHLSQDFYYLRPGKGADKPFDLLLATLAEKNLGLVVEWEHHGSRHLSLVSAVGESLALNTIPYRDQVREADDKIARNPHPDDKELEVAGQLLDAITQPFEYSAYEDVAAVEYEAAIEALVEGEDLPASKQAGAPATKAPDLMSALQAAVDAASGSKSKAKPRSKRTKAPA